MSMAVRHFFFLQTIQKSCWSSCLWTFCVTYITVPNLNEWAGKRINGQIRLVIKDLYKPSSSGRIHGCDSWSLTSWHVLESHICGYQGRFALNAWFCSLWWWKNGGIYIVLSFLGVNWVQKSGQPSVCSIRTVDASWPFNRKLHHTKKRSWAFEFYVHGEQPLLSCHGCFILLSYACVIGV